MFGLKNCGCFKCQGAIFSFSQKKKKNSYFLFTQVSTFSLIIKIVYLELNSIANSLFYVKHYLFQ